MKDGKKILKALTECPTFKNALVFAVQKMSGTLYAQQHGSLYLQTSDGMTRHADFNRGLAEHIQRYGAVEGIHFERSKRKNIDYVGNWVFGNKVGGQQRFSVQLAGQNIELLHMSGVVAADRITVYGIGKKREEFVKNQNSAIPKSKTWNLPVEAEQQEIPLPISWPCRLVLVTQVCGPRKNSIQLYLCLVDGQYNKEEGCISIIASELLAEVAVTAPALSQNDNQTQPNRKDGSFGIQSLISEKEKPEEKAQDETN
jgi:hypothetical protein